MFFCPSAQWLSPHSLDVYGIYPEAWPKTEAEFPDHEISGTYLLLLNAKRLQIGPGNTINNHWGQLELCDEKMKGNEMCLLGLDMTWTQSQFGNSGNPWQVVNRFNHMRQTLPAGGNALYLDGHVSWTPLELMKRELNPGLAMYRVPDEALSKK
jgi:prepilin-type processing-associated H-X9-DG protein